jgi:hypothetical protein
MKRLLFFVLLISTIASGQGTSFNPNARMNVGLAGALGNGALDGWFYGNPANYVYRATREREIAIMVDSTFHPPRYNGVPTSLRVGGSDQDGAFMIDTLNGYAYIFINGVYKKMANFSDIAGSTNVNIGSGFRFAVPNTNNIKTLHYGYGLSADSISNANEITMIFDSSQVSAYFLRRKDSATNTNLNGYLTRSSLPTYQTNIYNSNGRTTSNRIDSLDGHSLLFFGTSTNYPDPAVDSFKVANAATLFTNSLVTKRLTDVIVGGVNYGSYQSTDYAGSIFFRHYGAYATGCDICGKNTMNLKWTQNAAWDPVTASGGVDTLLHTMGAHNGPGDHHFFLGDLTDTYSNANRYITIEHNGAPFVGFYNNPVGNFAQFLFGSSASYSAIPNWENWHTIIGGKFAVKDTAGLFGAVKAPNLPTGKKAKQLYWDTDGNIYVGDSTGTGGGGSGTVTSFTFSDGNGFDGTVTNSTTTPTLSLTTTATDKAVMYSNSGAITGSSNMSQQTGFIRIGATSSAAPLQIFHHEDIGFGPLQLWYGSGDDTILQARADTSIWMRSEDSEFPSSVIPNTGWGKFYVRKDSARFMNYSGQEFTIGRSGVTSIAVSGANGIGVSGSPITSSGTIALSLGAITPTSVTTRWIPRVGSTTSSATPTINTDNYDIYKLTAQAAAITSFTTNLSGTPADGDVLEIQITDDGTARGITWGASFVSSSVALPTTTTISTTLTVIFQYYTTSSYGNNKWVCVNYY